MDWLAIGTVILTVLNGAFAAISAGRNSATKKTLDQMVPNAVDNLIGKLPGLISDVQKNTAVQDKINAGVQDLAPIVAPIIPHSAQVAELVDAMVKLADSITAHTEVVKTKEETTP